MNQALDHPRASTRERILALLLHAPEPLSTPTLAAELGISRNAVHQHIGGLERDGLIERADRLATGGRPSQGFRLSEAGAAFFPRQYALLARNLIAELARHLGPEALPASMARIGRELASQLAPRIPAPRAEVLPSIASLMRELGYEAHLAGPDGDVEIEAHNCLFHDLAMRVDRICTVYLALLGGLTGRTVEHRSCMARGQRSCRFGFGEEENSADAA
jgi:predicted ArsR family transcriptional regulator